MVNEKVGERESDCFALARGRVDDSQVMLRW